MHGGGSSPKPLVKPRVQGWGQVQAWVRTSYLWQKLLRLRDWFDLYIDDHGFLRFGWHNQHEFVAGAWRSNQPTPKRVARLARMGVATIINLRGKRDHGSWRLEKEACETYGVEMIDFTISSRAVPNYETIRAADALFAQARHPILFHCKSGADRAGVMAALYLLLHAGSDIDTAAKQLSLRYLHLKHSRTGLLDAFLDAYRPYARRGVSFRDWAEKHLDPDAITYHFRSQRWGNRWGNFLVDTILRRE